MGFGENILLERAWAIPVSIPCDKVTVKQYCIKQGLRKKGGNEAIISKVALTQTTQMC